MSDTSFIAFYSQPSPVIYSSGDQHHPIISRNIRTPWLDIFHILIRASDGGDGALDTV